VHECPVPGPSQCTHKELCPLLERAPDGLFEGEQAVQHLTGWGGGRRGCAGTRTRWLAEVHAAEARLLELHEPYASGEITLDDFKRMRDAVGRRAEAAEALMREMAPAPVPTRRFPSDKDFAEAEELYARWQRRELTPEEIAEQNDFFRAWIEKVVVSPALRRGRPRKGAPSDVPDRVRIVWR